jgi:peptidoglycan/xylan/chitin deacetylase (PgdA/CDA1 family)
LAVTPLRFAAVDRRRFLTMLGVGGAAVGGGVIGSAIEVKASAASTQAAEEDGTYAAGPQGMQRVLWSADTDQRVAAITFDDGPTPEFTQRFLDVLAAARVPATFFMIGKLVASYSSIARKVVAAGHEIGNHSWSHLSAATVSDGTNVSEIDRSTETIKTITGVSPAWYRPPRGMLVGASVRRAHENGQAVAMWSVTRGPGSIGDSDVDGVAKHLIDSIHPGAIIDLHDGVGSSAFGGPGGYSATLVRRRAAELSALPSVIAAWKAAGYTFVTLSDLAGL